MKLSIGVDLHKTQFTTCALSEDRALQESGIFPCNALGYSAFEKKLEAFHDEGYEVSLAVESTGNARYFRNRLLPKVVAIKIVNTMKFKVITESVKKTDKRDALTLAEFLEKDMLPESILCSQESETLRRILKSRSILVKALVSLKNQVHGLLLGYGIESKRGQLQSRKERQRILEGLADHGFLGNAAAAVHPLFQAIDQVSFEVKNLEEVLKELVAEDEDVELLQTIPGVGLITAATIRSYTDDISRYKTEKQYAAHAGLVPWVQNSNTTIRHGSITKRGPVELRTAFVQSVLGMVRLQKRTGSYRVMTSYQRMKKYKGTGKSIVATARKLNRIVYAILTTREPFDPEKMVSTKKIEEMRSAATDLATAA